MKRALVLLVLSLCLPVSARAADICIPEDCAKLGGRCFNGLCWYKLPTDNSTLTLMEEVDVPLRVPRKSIKLNYGAGAGGVSNGDGVGTRVSPTHEFHWWIGPINAEATAPPAFGSFQRFQSYGSLVPGGPSVLVSTGTVATTSLGRELAADFGALGATTFRTELYNGTALVMAANGRSGIGARTGSWPDEVRFGMRGFTPIQAWHYATPVALQLPGVGTATGDRVVFVAEGTAAMAWYDKSESPSVGLHDIELGHEATVDLPAASPALLVVAALAMMGAAGLMIVRIVGAGAGAGSKAA